jgi:hypothetical protein
VDPRLTGSGIDLGEILPASAAESRDRRQHRSELDVQAAERPFRLFWFAQRKVRMRIGPNRINNVCDRLSSASLRAYSAPPILSENRPEHHSIAFAVRVP